MRFAQPQLLWGLLLPVLWLALDLYSAHRRSLAWKKITDPETKSSLFAERSQFQTTMKTVFLFLGMTLAVVALARPQYGTSTVKQTRRGLDLVVAIDTSKSMLARDLVPDRLSRAKLELSSLLDQLHGDRVGFIAFAGEAFVQCPLTNDYAAAKVFLRALDTRTIPRGGTAIAEALQLSGQLLTEARERGGSKSQVVVVITDGEDHEGDPVAAAKTLAGKGISVFTVGVGSTSGEPIPMYDDKNTFLGYLKDHQGNTVLSRLDEGILKKIADAGGGRYVASSGGSTGVEQLLGDLASFEREEHEAKYKIVYTDRFQWLLIPSVFMLALSLSISARRRRPAVFSLLMFLFSLTCAAPAHASPFWAKAKSWLTAKNSKVETGNFALEQNKYDEAINAYKAAESEVADRPELWLDQGLALLKKGDAQGAKPLLERVFLAGDSQLRARAHYLLGNAAFDQQKYDEAIVSYKKALHEMPSDSDAKYNLELAQKLLQAQKDKEKNQNDKNDKKDDNKNKDKNDQQKDQNKKEQDKNNQNKDKQDQQNKDKKPETPKASDKNKNNSDQPEPQTKDAQNPAKQEQNPDQRKDEQQQRMQLLDALKAEEKPLRFNIFQPQKQKSKPVDKDW